MSSNELSVMSTDHQAHAGASSSARGATSRILSVDIGRGYTMALLIATPFLHQVFQALPDVAVAQQLRKQFAHSNWHGATYYDMGLPAFIYLVGMSVTLSLGKTVDSGYIRPGTYSKIFNRAFILFALGILANGGFKEPWPDVRVAGVLQRIAICYLVGSLVFLHFSQYNRVLFLVTLLVGYWTLLALVPVPGYGAGNWSFDENLAAYVDRSWLPGQAAFREAGWDSEGILSTIGAISTCVLGIVLAWVYRDAKWTPLSRAWYLALVGAALMATGYLWAWWVPLNKAIWTPSFVLFCGGQSTLCMAVICLINEVWKKQWLYPFVVIGRNSLAAYLMVGLLPWNDLAKRFVGGDIQRMFGTAGPLLVGVVQLTLCWLFLYWLYKRNLTMKF